MPLPTLRESRKLRFIAQHIVTLNKINKEVIVVGGRDSVLGRKPVMTATVPACNTVNYTYLFVGKCPAWFQKL